MSSLDTSINFVLIGLHISTTKREYKQSEARIAQSRQYLTQTSKLPTVQKIFLSVFSGWYKLGEGS